MVIGTYKDQKFARQIGVPYKERETENGGVVEVEGGRWRAMRE